MVSSVWIIEFLLSFFTKHNNNFHRPPKMVNLLPLTLWTDISSTLNSSNKSCQIIHIFILTGKGGIGCNVVSSTHERKTKTNLIINKGKIYLKFSRFVMNNKQCSFQPVYKEVLHFWFAFSFSLTENIPVVVIFKAMGLESDQAVVQLVGNNRATVTLNILVTKLVNLKTDARFISTLYKSIFKYLKSWVLPLLLSQVLRMTLSHCSPLV